MLKILRNRTQRGYVIQAVAVAVVLALVTSFALTAQQKLVSQGIATGFGFLDRSTGWPINFSLIEVTDRSPYSRMLLAGLLRRLSNPAFREAFSRACEQKTHLRPATPWNREWP